MVANPILFQISLRRQTQFAPELFNDKVDSAPHHCTPRLPLAIAHLALPRRRTPYQNSNQCDGRQPPPLSMNLAVRKRPTEEADERLQEPATKPACKISRAPQDDNVMLSTSDYLSSYKFSSQRNLYYGFAFTWFRTGEASGHDKKLPGKEETAQKVKPRPEKTSNSGGTKAVDL
ncbi:hypothetical protein C1H46_028406 [Malus baccata]|uniref:Uncharacterized protein n=1 Tax=Malus baccata TaxID=106549 RepID=A0A540LHV1_MALBA|nr:hypothetical protein C1H46_028406 [Malus baccata]